jgi:CDP-glucose 4,6-dehydratase
VVFGPGTLESVALIAADPGGFWSGKRVVVTGHTGFKGAWLSFWLRRLGADVAGFALDPQPGPNAFRLSGLPAQMDSRIGDIRDAAAIEACIAAHRPAVIFHLAAQALVRAGFANPIGTYETNAIGTANVLLAARACDSVRAIVVVTSDKCYDLRTGAARHTENDPLGGDEPYSASKACAEHVAASLRATWRDRSNAAARIAVARAGNVIGGGDWSTDRLVPDAVAAFTSGAPLELRYPAAIRPWQFVLDPLAAYIDIARRLIADDGASIARAWNLGPSSDHERPVAWVADALAAAWGPDATWRPAPGAHPVEATALRLDSSAAERSLGWRSRVDLAMTIRRTVAWYRAQLGGADVATLMDDEIARFEAAAA